MDYEESKQSRFNAGVALAERVDSLQRGINMARFNPLQMNPETMTFNYQIMISANDALFSEAWGKLTDAEKKLGLSIREYIQAFLELHPILEQQSNGATTINYSNFRQLMPLIDFYEKKNKEFLEEHSLNAPNADDDDGL